MAKNYNRDDDPEDGPDVAASSIIIDKPNVKQLDVVPLSKRQLVLGYSFVAIALIMLLSFVIPDKYYGRTFNIFLLNVELLVIFARDIYLYFKKSCNLVRIIMCLMTGIYTLNCIDLIVGLPHYLYLEFSIVLITLGLAVLSVIKQIKSS